MSLWWLGPRSSLDPGWPLARRPHDRASRLSCDQIEHEKKLGHARQKCRDHAHLDDFRVAVIPLQAGIEIGRQQSLHVAEIDLGGEVDYRPITLVEKIWGRVERALNLRFGKSVLPGRNLVTAVADVAAVALGESQAQQL